MIFLQVFYWYFELWIALCCVLGLMQMSANLAESNKRRCFYSEAKKVQHGQGKDNIFSVHIVISVTIENSTSDAFYRGKKKLWNCLLKNVNIFNNICCSVTAGCQEGELRRGSKRKQYCNNTNKRLRQEYREGQKKCTP